jgi:hypothetical protein
VKATKKAKPDNVANELQASTASKDVTTRETLAKVRRGFKRLPPELEEIIRVVNLLPENPPPLPLTTEDANSLPPALSEYLNELYEAEYEHSEDYTHSWDYMEWQYREIVEAREALQQLMREATEVTDEQTIYFHDSIDARAYLSISKDRRVRVEISSFARAVAGIEIDYLRNCQTCANIFYAGRKNQQCCTVKCAKAQRQKRWRQRFKDGEPAYHK